MAVGEIVILPFLTVSSQGILYFVVRTSLDKVVDQGQRMANVSFTATDACYDVV